MSLEENFDYKGFLSLLLLATFFNLLNSFLTKDSGPLNINFNSKEKISVKFISGKFLSPKVSTEEKKISMEGLNLNSAPLEILTQTSKIKVQLLSEIISERETGLFSDWDDLKKRIPEIKEESIQEMKKAGITISPIEPLTLIRGKNLSSQ